MSDSDNYEYRKCHKCDEITSYYTGHIGRISTKGTQQDPYKTVCGDCEEIENKKNAFNEELLENLANLNKKMDKLIQIMNEKNSK